MQQLPRTGTGTGKCKASAKGNVPGSVPPRPSLPSFQSDCVLNQQGNLPPAPPPHLVCGVAVGGASRALGQQRQQAACDEALAGGGLAAALPRQAICKG